MTQSRATVWGVDAHSSEDIIPVATALALPAAAEQQIAAVEISCAAYKDPACAFFSKYFLEGQNLHAQAKETNQAHDNSLLFKYRKYIAFAMPPVIAWIAWLTYMIKSNGWHHFTQSTGDVPNWNMSVTMIFGSFVAGATSEGGASIAFPIMTLILGIAPPVARDFSFMIQSCGMTSAAATILLMGVRVEPRSIIYCTISATYGVIFGLEHVVPKLEFAENKMYFVCIWLAFACNLYWLNKFHGRRVFQHIPDWREGPWYLDWMTWRALALLCTGFLGGIFTSMSGSGLCICSFAILTLFFRVSEKVATPTSIILMAMNTVVAFMYRQYGMGGVSQDAWPFFKVCIPVVVLCAPLGALASSHWHRLVHAGLIYTIDLAQFAGALYVVQPWTHKEASHPQKLMWSCFGILLGGVVFFWLLGAAGQKLMIYNGYGITMVDEQHDDGNETAEDAVVQLQKESNLAAKVAALGASGGSGGGGGSRYGSNDDVEGGGRTLGRGAKEETRKVTFAAPAASVSVSQSME